MVTFCPLLIDPSLHFEIDFSSRLYTEYDMKTGKFLVVGGYGYEGQTISTALASQFPGRVVAANLRKTFAPTISEALPQTDQ